MVDRYGFRDSDFDRPEKNRRGVFNSKNNAILVLMEPITKQFNDVGYRPMLYNFDEGALAQHGEDLMLKSSRGSHSVNEMAASLFKNIDAASSMIPSLNVDSVFRASKLNDSYRFVLILTSDPRERLASNSRILNRNARGKTRRIYSGVCIGEPISRGMFRTDKRLNPECQLKIMRKVVTEITHEDGARGSSTQLTSRFADEIINPDMVRDLRSSRDTSLELLLPERISQGIVASDDQISSAPGLATDISDEKEEIVFSNLLENPRNHVDTLARAFTLMVDEKAAGDRLGHRRDSAWDIDNEHSLEMRTTAFQNYLHVPTSGLIDEADLDVHDTITMEDIDERFDPEVIEFGLEDALLYDTADHRERSTINQYSYLIAIITPTILSSLGLNDIHFIYEVEKRRGQIHPSERFRIKHIEPVYEVSNAELEDMERAFRSEMRKSCLDHIFATIGDFHLVCECDVTGFTTIRLNPVEAGMRCEVDFEIPTLLGGNISPMIGSEVDSASNTDSLVNVWQTLLGNRDTPEDNDLFERPELISRYDNDEDYPEDQD